MLQKLNIAMVSDFYYPATGGIETHIRHISKCLIDLGHNVIIITHKHDACDNFANLKVYKLDLPILALNTTFPSLYSNFYVLKKIFDHEQINVVHGHQTMSNLCLEALFHACTLNIRTIVTEHSLFGESAIENVITNSLTKFLLADVDRFICVSQTSRENICSRLQVDCSTVAVIPNGVLSEHFYINNSNKRVTKNVMIMSRLVYRKGIDLLVEAIPLICKHDANIRIFIAGEGPKIDEIRQVIDDYDLDSQVKVIGFIAHNKVGEFLQAGDVFLNTSLTETFCLAILEAAMCGLHVVSTNVGGVHEVLPKSLITYCKLVPEDIASKVIAALKITDRTENANYYNYLRDKYSWHTVAIQTAKLYSSIASKKCSFEYRLSRHDGIFKRFLIIIEYLCMYIIKHLPK